MLKNDKMYVRLLEHVKVCRSMKCDVPKCDFSRKLLKHFQSCTTKPCVICGPTQEHTKKLVSMQQSWRDNHTRLPSASSGAMMQQWAGAGSAGAPAAGPSTASMSQDPATQAALAIVQAGSLSMVQGGYSAAMQTSTSSSAPSAVSTSGGAPLHPTAVRQHSFAPHSQAQPAQMSGADAFLSFAASLVAANSGTDAAKAAGRAAGPAAPQPAPQRSQAGGVSTGGFSAFAAHSGARPQSLRLATSQSTTPAAVTPSPAPAAAPSTPSTPKLNEQREALAALSRFRAPPAAPAPKQFSDEQKKVVQNKLDPHYCQLYQFTLDQMQRHKERLRSDFNPLYPPARIKATFKPLVKRLIEKDENGFFTVPVDPVLHACPDYLQVIKRPMDLGTVSKKLDRSEYRTVESLHKDIMQIWRNAKMYNPVGHGVHSAAQGMEESASRLMKIEIDKMADMARKRQRQPDMNICSLCEGSTLMYDPPTIFCNTCDRRVKKDSYYYTDNLHRYHWCTTCFRESKDPVKMEDRVFNKSELSRKKHDNDGEEPWVCCDQCRRWQHQVCALFNGHRGNAASETGVDMQYYCCDCMIDALKARGVQGPASRLRIPSADAIPTHSLDVRIEKHVNAVLERKWKEQQEKAQRVNAAPGAGPAELPDDLKGPAPQIILRLMSCNTRDYAVGPEFVRRYGGMPQEGGRNYPSVLPYRSKSLYMFQNIDGVDVLLFAMYVQEYDEYCPPPNTRTAYLAYLDSVKFFSVPWLRTDLYKEVLVAYMQDLRRRGFDQMLIWACPPKEGDDYILFCHPEEQRTPKDKRLQKWYIDILREANKRSIVHRVVHLADDYFPAWIGNEGGRDRDVYELPNYEGDYWPRQGEDESKTLRLEAEEDGEPLLPGMKAASSAADTPTAETSHQNVTDVAASKLTARKQGMVLPVKLALDLAAARTAGSRREKPSGKPIPMPPPAYARRSAVLLHRASVEVAAAADARREAAYAAWQTGKSGKGAEMITRAKSKGDKAKKKRGKIPKGKAKNKGPILGVNDMPLRDDPLRYKVFQLLTQSPIMHTGFLVAKLRPSCQVYKTYIRPNERYYSYTGLNPEASRIDPKAQKGRDMFKTFMADQLYVADLSMKAWKLPDAEIKRALGKHPLAARFNRQDWTPSHESFAQVNQVDQPLLRRLNQLNKAAVFYKEKLPEYQQLSRDLQQLVPVCSFREAVAKKEAGQDVQVPEQPQNAGALLQMPLEELVAKVSGMRERYKRLHAHLEQARKGNNLRYRTMLPDVDKDVDRRFFGTRQLFLDLCRGNHYQFDQLRRAKHSSMMLLYHVFNVNAPSYVYHCNECGVGIARDEEQGLEGIRWSCTQCNEYDICEKCKQKTTHQHLLVPFSTIGTLADMDEGNDRTLVGEMLDRAVGIPKLAPPPAEQTPSASPTPAAAGASNGTSGDKAAAKTPAASCDSLDACSRSLQLLQHSPACTSDSCTEQGCKQMKEHLAEWKRQIAASSQPVSAQSGITDDDDDFSGGGSSPLFLAMWNLVKLHALQCDADPNIGKCPVPHCATLKLARERRRVVALRAIRGSVARRGGEAMGGTATAGDEPDDAPQATEAEKAKSAESKAAAKARTNAGQSRLVIPENIIARTRNILRECPQLSPLAPNTIRSIAKWAAYFEGKLAQHKDSPESVNLAKRLANVTADPSQLARYKAKLASIIAKAPESAGRHPDLSSLEQRFLDIFVKAAIYNDLQNHRKREAAAAAAAASTAGTAPRASAAPQAPAAAAAAAGSSVNGTSVSAASGDRVGGSKRRLESADTSLASASKKATPFGVPLKASVQAAMTAGSGHQASALVRNSAQVKLDAASRVGAESRSRDRSRSPPSKRPAQ